MFDSCNEEIYACVERSNLCGPIQLESKRWAFSLLICDKMHSLLNDHW